MPSGDGWEVPPDMEGWSDWTWFKVRGGSVLKLVVLSAEPLWYRGHYTKGRMVPCLGEGCQNCQEKVGTQLRYVFGVAEVTYQKVGLLEVGRQVALELRDFQVRWGALRGMQVALTKHSYAKNSRIECELVERELGPWWNELGCPDVRRALVCTWEKAKVPVPVEMGEGKQRVSPFRRTSTPVGGDS